MSKAILTVDSLQARQAISPISFELPTSGLLVLFAPPGLGKSILLHSIAGLHDPRNGEVTFEGEKVHSLSAEALDVLRLKFGYLPGEGQLMSNLSLYENLVLPLRYHTDLSESEIKKKAQETLALVGLDYIPGPLADRREKRLVAIARTLILDPNLLLLDEPADGMDPEHADELWRNLSIINSSKGIAMVIATKVPPDHLVLKAEHLILKRRETVTEAGL